jgi:hypothetical protein
MKNENICWGNGKIQGELEKLGIELDKRTIAGIIEYFRRKGRVSICSNQVVSIQTFRECIRFGLDNFAATLALS